MEWSKENGYISPNRKEWSNWYRWYAWFPVRLNGKVVWFEFIYRRRKYAFFSRYDLYEYGTILNVLENKHG